MHRPRLDDLFDRAAASGITTVLLAPPGYGKTTALAGWAARTAYPVAWLTLTRHDRGVPQILSGILSALQRLARARPELAELLEIIPDTEDDELMLERLCAALSTLPDTVTLVIDDAQLGPRELVESIICVLTEHSAGRIRFVVTGTQQRDAWFTVARSTGAATLLGAEVLAMTVGEIAELAAEFGPERAAAIHAATDGWPVAVTIALRTATDDAPGGAIPGAGADLLAEYISQTVLAGLRPELVAFIRAVTTCSRVNARLAELLSGRADAGALLDECVRRGLFLDRFVDGERDPIYRWQEAFASHCRIATRRDDEVTARQLNVIAAEYLADSFSTEATVHAERADAPELAATIIRQNWVRLVTESHAAALNARCLALPDALAQSPEMLLIRACCLDVEGDGTGALLLFSRARSVIDQPGFVGDDNLEYTRAFADLFLAHDRTTLIAAADRVRKVLGTATTGLNAHTHALFLLGWVELRLRRDPAEAVRLLTSAHRDAVAAGRRTLARRAVTNLMFAYSYGGYFTAAHALSARGDVDADADSAWQHYDGGIELVARGFVDYWQNNLDAAQVQLRALLQQGGHSTSYTALARVYFAMTAAATGDARLIAEARDQLSGISDAEAHGVPWHSYRAIAGAVLAAASGDHARALILAEPLAGTEAGSIPVVHVLLAEIYRKLGHPDRALQVLNQIEHPERVSYVIASALVTTAAVVRQRGDRTRAHRYLERALDVAVPEGIARPFFADEDDQALHELLTEHAAWGTAHEGFLAAQIASRTGGVSRHQVLGSALSPREREIFGFLCTTMTADEIADELHVSVNTVRTHQRAIYRKLGVGNRREAIKLRI